MNKNFLFFDKLFELQQKNFEITANFSFDFRALKQICCKKFAEKIKSAVKKLLEEIEKLL